MSFMGTLFGDSNSESESSFDFYGPTKEPINNIIGEVWGTVQDAQRAIDDGMPDDFVADMNRRQQMAVDQLYGSGHLQTAIDQTSDMYGQGAGFTASGAQPLQQVASGQQQVGIADDIFNSIYNEDMMNQRVDMVGQDIARNLQEGQLLDIDRQYGFGQSGSGRAGIAEGMAIRGGQEALADAATQIRTDTYNQAVQQGMAVDQARQDARMNAGSQLLGTGIGQQQFGTTAGAQFGQDYIDNRIMSGNIEQAQSQAEIQGQLDRMNLQSTLPFQPLLLGQQALLPFATAGGTSHTEGEGPSPGIMGGIMGMAGGAADIMTKK